MLLLAAAGFAAGWLARGARSPEAAYGRLTPTGGECRVRARPAPDLEEYTLASVLPSPPPELPGTQTLLLRRTRRDAELWVAQAGVDDEVAAEAMRYQLAWDESTGWVVKDCSLALRRDF